MRAALLAAALGLGATSGAGCTSSDGDVPIVYAPHDGGAVYPSRRPKLPRAEGYLALVSDNGSDTISVVDLPAGKLLASIPVGRDPVGIDGPHHLAVDARGFVYVALAYPAPTTSPGPHSAHSSSRRAGYVQKLAPDDLRVVGEVRVEPNPGDIVLSDDGARLVVSHFDLTKAIDPSLELDARRATLAVIDPSRIAAQTDAPTQIPVCLAPHGVALSRPNGSTAFVACYGEDAIGVVSLDDPKAPVVRVPVGANAAAAGAPVYGPYSAVLSPSAKLLAVGNTESKDTRFFDTEARAMTPLVVVTQGAPFFAAWSADEAKIFVPTQSPDALVVADARTGAILAQRRFEASVCTRPHEAVFGRDESALLLVCEGDHVGPGTLLLLDPITLDTRVQLALGVYPDRIVFPRVP